MTQFKDKSHKQGESSSTGLFTYPTLMAQDILLYDTDLVPVGEDQTQHIELTCKIAHKFNTLYSQVFKLPKATIDREAARIMSLQHPQAKMSKSDKDPVGTVNLLDLPEQIVRKFSRAVTDSHPAFSGEQYLVEQPPTDGLTNLLTIFAKVSGQTFAAAVKQFDGVGYGKLKQEIAEAVVAHLQPIQAKYQRLRQEGSELQKYLDAGRDFAISRSSQKVKQIKEVMGIGRS